MQHADNCIGTMRLGPVFADGLVLIDEEVELSWDAFVSYVKQLHSPWDLEIECPDLPGMVRYGSLLDKVKGKVAIAERSGIAVPCVSCCYLTTSHA